MIRFLIALAAGAALVFPFLGQASAEDPGVSAPPAAKDPFQAARAKFARLRTPATSDSEAIAQYVAEIKLKRPKSAEEFLVLREKIRDASEKILGLGLDRQSESFRNAETDFMESTAILLTTQEHEAQTVGLARIIEYLRGRDPLRLEHARLAITTAKGLESHEAKSLAARAYSEFTKIFKDSDIAEDITATFDSGARRLGALGEVLRIEGKTLGGEAFDLRSMQGKVVLVDFWASWCQPCVAEHKELLQLHAKYHEQGLEIVGLSFDEDRRELQTYLNRRKLPWITLFDETGQGKHEASARYGVRTLPAMYLVDRTGKAIMAESRVERFRETLEKIFSAGEENAQNP